MKIFGIIRSFFLLKKINRENGYKREKYEDRNVLETIIIPFVLLRRDPDAILDIGREDYQAFYNEYFAGRELWTMDIDPERAEFGAKNHITDNAANVATHFPAGKFDLVLLNGVVNWGLNRKNEVEKCLSGIFRIMKPGGLLVLGWNDFPDEKIIRPQAIKALEKFRPFRFPPLKSAQFKCVNGEHTYNFYEK